LSLIITKLTKKYGQTLAVKEITFQAGPGQVLGFLGPNGAGKSTTMKIATGYLPATSGTVHVMGIAASPAEQEAKKLIGYLPEHNPLYLDMYVQEYLSFSGQCYGMRGSALAKAVASAIEKTGLGGEYKKKIGALSKGYRQRVGLAQTLVHNPPVLILDEPTTGLDPNQIIEIRNLIKEVGREKTVVLSTHIMQEVEAICTRYVIIHQGQIAAEGSVGFETEGLMLRLELDKPVDISELLVLPGIAAASTTAEATYVLDLTDEKAGRAAVLRFCADNGLDVRSLTRQGQSLEQIFKTATAG